MLWNRKLNNDEIKNLQNNIPSDGLKFIMNLKMVNQKIYQVMITMVR